MALAWILTDERVTSVIIGASSVRQLMSNIKTLDNTAFTEDELAQISSIIS